MAGFLAGTFFAAAGDGRIGFIKADAPPRLIRVHDSAILSAAIIPGQQVLLTAGDDGRLRQTGLNGAGDNCDFAALDRCSCGLAYRVDRLVKP
jgi:hypothetical protein